MKILIYGNPEIPNIYWDVSTDEKADAAFKKLFTILDAGLNRYNDLTDSLMECKKNLLEKREVQRAYDTLPELLKPTAKKILEGVEFGEQAFSLSNMDKQLKLYKLAKTGDVKAMQKLLKERKTYEYEKWEIVTVINPVE